MKNFVILPYESKSFDAYALYELVNLLDNLGKIRVSIGFREATIYALDDKTITDLQDAICKSRFLDFQVDRVT